MSTEPENTQETATIAETIEKNKRDALRLAGELFRVVKDPEFLKLTPEVRMNVVKEKCPEFCKHYPMVASWMTYHLKYSHKAFAKYLDKLASEHGKQEVKQGEGYKAWARKQADYAKILYMETTNHWSSKVANRIWTSEYRRILKTYDEMKDEEAKYKSEFEDEKEQHHDELIDEILSLVGQVKKETSIMEDGVGVEEKGGEDGGEDDVHSGESVEDEPTQLDKVLDQASDADDSVDDDLVARAEEIKKMIDRKVRIAEGKDVDDDDSSEELTPEEIEQQKIREEKMEIRRKAEIEWRKQQQEEAKVAAVERSKEVQRSFLPDNIKQTKSSKRKRRRKRKKRN